MNRYLKLVHMEIHRFRYILAGLMGLTAAVQLLALAPAIANEVAKRRGAASIGKTFNNGNPNFPGDGLSFAEAVFNTNGWFTLSIVLCAALLVLYLLIIWYRDWLGRDTFIYRLLMLPTARRHIYLAKLTASLIFIFAMLAFQLLLLLLAEQLLFRSMVPADMRIDSPFTDTILYDQALSLFLPHSFADFLVSYGFGIVVVLILFTAVLIERSYRVPGIFYALLYIAACAAAILVTPFAMGIEDAGGYFYTNEIWAAQVTVIGLVAGVSVWLGFRLLNRKVTV